MLHEKYEYTPASIEKRIINSKFKDRVLIKSDCLNQKNGIIKKDEIIKELIIHQPIKLLYEIGESYPKK